MSKVVIDDIHLTNIAKSIRSKAKNETTLTPAEMSLAIDNIPSGGGGGAELPPEAYKLSGDCSNKFANGNFGWYLDLIASQGKKITTKDIGDCDSMFSWGTDWNTAEQKCPTSYPIDEINLVKNDGWTTVNLTSMFRQCRKLEKVPLIKGDIYVGSGFYVGGYMQMMFMDCVRLREIPYDYFNNFGGKEFWEKRKGESVDTNEMFNNCYSLRKAPDVRNLWTSADSSYNSFWNSSFLNCFALDELTNLPVPTSLPNGVIEDFVTNCGRLKSFTFETNPDGAPIKVGKLKPEEWQWTSGNIFDLSKEVGNTSVYRATGYNSGITADKEVKDDASYQRLKDNPDWFTCDIAYSRYNKTSALETIKSLPDLNVSENPALYETIKFKGDAGSKTDGGAIKTLTEQEIAIAAAKGWTVTLV